MRYPKRKNPYTYPHKSREAKVNYLCGIGGYYCLAGRFPIEFNVGAYYADFDFDNIWKKYAADCWPFDEKETSPAEMKAYYDLARRLHKEYEQHLWSWGHEEAVRSLEDDDTYKCLWDGTDVSVTLGLYGRGGKHLVISQFEGVSLEGRSEENLESLLLTQTNWYDTVTDLHKLKKGYVWLLSSEWLDTFYRYVRQCEEDFTIDKASAEIEYRGATSFFYNQVNSEWETVKAERASHEATVEAAQAIKTALVFSTTPDIWGEFTTLCTAAGVTMDEVENG